jgi:cysteine synthase
VHAAAQVADGLSGGQRVVVIVCDTGERYLGSFLFE